MRTLRCGYQKTISVSDRSRCAKPGASLDRTRWSASARTIWCKCGKACSTLADLPAKEPSPGRVGRAFHDCQLGTQQRQLLFRCQTSLLLRVGPPCLLLSSSRLFLSSSRLFLGPSRLFLG